MTVRGQPTGTPSSRRMTVASTSVSNPTTSSATKAPPMIASASPTPLSAPEESMGFRLPSLCVGSGG